MLNTHSPPPSNISHFAENLYRMPLFELLFQAHQVHKSYHSQNDIQKCTLLSVKTGGCPENCGYCPQSAHYDVDLKSHPLLPIQSVREEVTKAKKAGAQRFCMGAAWREVKNGPDFEKILEMIRVVKEENLEACVTLGMLTFEQAMRLKEAGLDAYNHNLDTSRAYYPQIISSRTYDDRLQTLKSVRKAGLSVCSGGIIGMGESISDRCELLGELASLSPQPESVPINVLVPVEGTPLAHSDPIDPLELIRTVAVARILMPRARVRLSAGRTALNRESQILAFFAGANSIFLGEKLLTTPNPHVSDDYRLLNDLGAISQSATHSASPKAPPKAPQC